MYQRIRQLISVRDAKDQRRLSSDKKSKFDAEVKKCIEGENKFLLIVGPCSADSHAAVMKYCEKLKEISLHVEQNILILPRVYTTKPRSWAGSYRGILHSPDLGTENFNEGIFASRSLMVDIAENFGFFAADEMLYPELYPYFDDLLSYITIGARSSENQFHRMAASGIEVPVGIKNPMNGDIKALVGAVSIAQSPNRFVLNGYEVGTSGNVWAHGILRGFTDERGNMKPNFSPEFLSLYEQECNERMIKPALIVDCNHCNSGKDYSLEPEIALKTIGFHNKIVRGLMIESYLLDGKQNEPIEFGKSLTDGCLGIEKTERLIYDIANRL